MEKEKEKMNVEIKVKERGTKMEKVKKRWRR